MYSTTHHLSGTKSQAQFQRNLLTKFLNYKRPNLSPSTYTLYEYCLESFALHYPISADGVNLFISDLTCGNAKGNYHQIVNTFVRWLFKMGYIADNPMDMIDKAKRV